MLGRETQHEVYVDEEELRTATVRLPLPPDTPDFELPVLVQLSPLPEPRHTYLADDSADHARRLLRRAENADKPDEETAELLETAFAHQITQAFGRPFRAGRAALCFSLYEHAFLLQDGTEISLWEVEHTATPDGRRHVRGVRQRGRGPRRDGAAGGAGLVATGTAQVSPEPRAGPLNTRRRISTRRRVNARRRISTRRRVNARR